MRNVQAVGVDEGGGAVDNPRAMAITERVVEAVRACLAGRSQKEIAARLPGGESQFSRFLRGKGSTDPTLSYVLLIEDALGLRPGQLLRQAGLVEEIGSTRDAIVSDSTLTPRHRDTLLSVYDSFASEASASTKARTPRRSPRR